MKYVSPNEWTTCEGVVLEEAADQAVHSNKNVLVIAGPGSGKTELLAQKAAFLFMTNSCIYPRKILAICFKTDAADNLKERVVRRCGKEVESRFVSHTYDAFAKSILDHFRLALPKDITPSSDYLVNDDNAIDAAFKKAGYINSNGLTLYNLKKFYDNTLSSVILPLKGNLLSCKVWKLLLKGYDDNKACLSYKMITILSKYIIDTNPLIKKAIQSTYAHLFLDEFQDTTSLQYELVKSSFHNSQTVLTAVGDNKQRIMLWAGALKGVFSKFYSEYKPLGVRLIMNHRSAPRLVNLQSAMYNSLNDKKGKVKYSERWNENDGEIILYITASEKLEARALAQDIQTKLSSGVSPNDICVLCKQLPQDYTNELIKTLACYHIRSRIETEYQDLIKEQVIKIIVSIVLLSYNRQHPNEWEYIISIICSINGIDYNSQGILYQNIESDLINMLDNVKDKLDNVKSQEDLQKAVEYILNYLNIKRLISYCPYYSDKEYLNDIINRFVSLFYIEFKEANNSWIGAIDGFNGYKSIPIMTIHKSKGLEYTAVYFVGLEDSAFWNFSRQADEDRCAFFVALSRAKKSIAFTFCQNRDNLRNSRQSHNQINEFFELLQQSDMAQVIHIDE